MSGQEQAIQHIDEQIKSTVKRLEYLQHHSGKPIWVSNARESVERYQRAKARIESDPAYLQKYLEFMKVEKESTEKCDYWESLNQNPTISADEKQQAEAEADVVGELEVQLRRELGLNRT